MSKNQYRKFLKIRKVCVMPCLFPADRLRPGPRRREVDAGGQPEQTQVVDESRGPAAAQLAEGPVLMEIAEIESRTC